MAYSNWKNPFEEDDEDPTYWYEGFGQAGKTAMDSFGKSMGVFWKDMTNGSLKRGLKEQGNLLASAYKGPQAPPQPVKPNYNPGGYSQDTMKVMAKADRMYNQAQVAFNGSGLKPINSYGLMGSVVPKPATKPIYTYGLMGSTIRPDVSSVDSVRRWLQAESLKWGSQGTTFPGVTIPQDRSVNVDTGYRIPTSMPNDNFGNYGGYLSYGGGGGGYSYKPAPKPWYMSLTNWRI